MEDKPVMPADVEKISDETLAVYHILQLAQQGRFEYIIAQMIASAVLASDANSAQLFDMKVKIEETVINLLIDASEIWDGLLPGPGTSWPKVLSDLEMISGTDWARLKTENIELNDKARAFDTIVEIMSEDTPDVLRCDSITRVLQAYGFVSQKCTGCGADVFLKGELYKRPDGGNHTCGDLPMSNEDTYVVSIIVDPSVRHDETTDLIGMAISVDAESPLNLAKHVLDRIEHFDLVGRWPAEELSAWITHGRDGEHFIMTWDQANAIVILDEAKERLDRIGYELGGDLDDTFQGIADQMLISGSEYAAGK